MSRCGGALPGSAGEFDGASDPWVVVGADEAALFNDKHTHTVDTVDPSFVYAVWVRLEPAGNGPTLLARSVNAGLSWEPVWGSFDVARAGVVIHRPEQPHRCVPAACERAQHGVAHFINLGSAAVRR